MQCWGEPVSQQVVKVMSTHTHTHTRRFQLYFTYMTFLPRVNCFPFNSKQFTYFKWHSQISTGHNCNSQPEIFSVMPVLLLRLEPIESLALMTVLLEILQWQMRRTVISQMHTGRYTGENRCWNTSVKPLITPSDFFFFFFPNDKKESVYNS